PSFHRRLLLRACGVLLALHCFPTRRSSDLTISRDIKELNIIKVQNNDGSSSYTVLNDDKYSIGSKIHEIFKLSVQSINKSESGIDRKSTRLNSSHVSISYAVFCLKKKKICL